MLCACCACQCELKLTTLVPLCCRNISNQNFFLINCQLLLSPKWLKYCLDIQPTYLFLQGVDVAKILSDRPKFANQHMETRHNILLTAYLTWQFGIIFFHWPLAHQRGQIDCAWGKERNVPNTWVLLHFCWTSCQWAEHSVSWQHINSVHTTEYTLTPQPHTSGM